MRRRDEARLAESPRDAGAEVRDKALGWLARREYSRHELQQRLLRQGYARDVVAQELDALVTQGLVSDPRFTEAFVRNRVERGYGPRRILFELRERGIDDGLAEPILAEWEDQWVVLAHRAYSKKFGSRQCDDHRERARRARFLQYRGFSADQFRFVFGADEQEPT